MKISRCNTPSNNIEIISVLHSYKNGHSLPVENVSMYKLTEQTFSPLAVEVDSFSSAVHRKST